MQRAPPRSRPVLLAPVSTANSAFSQPGYAPAASSHHTVPQRYVPCHPQHSRPQHGAPPRNQAPHHLSHYDRQHVHYHQHTHRHHTYTHTPSSRNPDGPWAPNHVIALPATMHVSLCLRQQTPAGYSMSHVSVGDTCGGVHRTHTNTCCTTLPLLMVQAELRLTRS